MIEQIKALFPGFLTCVTIALASTFIADHYGGPVMLFALLFGTAFHFLDNTESCKAGIDFCAKTLLRLGVALLGFRITFHQLSALGWEPLSTTFVCVVLTIVLGVIAARCLKLSYFFGILASCTVAICGASAALAVASVLPLYDEKERDTILVVVTVTALSTLAMILYPVLVKYIYSSQHEMGIFLGATIHDVAQVVGAGYTISDEVGDTATVIKLFRVALLVPVVIILSLLMRRHQSQDKATSFLQTIPLFLVGFVVFVVINSSGYIPKSVADSCSDFSRWLLVAAIAALGIKTSFQDLGLVGIRPIALMIICTFIIAILVYVANFIGTQLIL